MAEKKKRVHHLAKELLVKSKTIIEKCHAEGIDIKNHMHVVSAGLEATIREWFSDGAHTTTLEESGRVDLAVVRVKPKRTRKKKGATTVEAEGAVATMEAPAAEAVLESKPKADEKAETPKRKSPKEVAGEVAEGAVVVALEAPAVVDGEAAPTVPASMEEVETTVVVEPSVPVAEPSEAPPIAPAPEAPPAAAPPSGADEEASPAAAAAASAPDALEASPPEQPPLAGPQNIPEPAKLSGPKVVRFDKPEVVDRPRPQRSSTFTPGRPAARGPATKEEGADESQKERGRGRGGRPGSPAAAAAAAKRGHPRRGMRDTRDLAAEKFREWRDRDLEERRERLSHASGRGIGGLRAIEGRQGARRSGQRTPQVIAKRDKVELSEPILIKDMSRETGITAMEIVGELVRNHGVMVGVNSGISSEHAQLIAVEYGIELTVRAAKSGMEKLAEEHTALTRDHMEPRAPVVTVLGHVDHGKTSLLDRIRESAVASGEAGGITQHIGASRVKVNDKWVTFLDTPGHAAFTAMRARGADMTDVVVLVVAADDGVMPTTVEAINHARAASATIVVALNKIDLPHDLPKIYGQLAEHGLTPSGEWGGETDVVKTSAVTGEGVNDLLEHLATLSEVMELQADATVPATGVVIEAERSGATGSLARVLVQEGTLKKGDVIVCGAAHGRVRTLRNASGKQAKKAGPSTPVEVTGLNDVPSSADRFFVVDSARRAKDIAQEMSAQRREQALVQTAKPTNLESVLASAVEGRIPELQVIVRADVQGSVDVLQKTLSEFPRDQVKLGVIHAGVGTVTESDIVLAQASNAIIVAFHVVPDAAIVKMADSVGVDIRSYRVIYRLIDDIRKALEGLLTPDERLESRGRAEVREVFTVSRIGKVAGCYVVDGAISRSHKVRVVRDGVPVKEDGVIDSLRRFKDDVKEVRSGFECGIRVEAYDDLKPGDVVEAFEVVKVAKTLD